MIVGALMGYLINYFTSCEHSIKKVVYGCVGTKFEIWGNFGQFFANFVSSLFKLKFVFCRILRIDLQGGC